MTRHPLPTLVACYLLIAAHLTAPSPASGHGKAQVLILHAYHQGLAWTDAIHSGILSVLEKLDRPVELHVEYMDTKRHAPDLISDDLETIYRRKYQRISLDVVILSDNNALDFVLVRRDALFPDVPIVFCGINSFEDAMIAGQTRITGIVEDIDVAATVELVIELLPETRRIVAINDRTPTGKANQRKFTEAARRFRDQVRFIELLGPSTPMLTETLRQLPPDTAILVFTYHLDEAGRWYSISDFLSLITANADVPSFSFWAHYLGGGITGGIMVSGASQGAHAARMAVEIIRGVPTDDPPIVRTSPNVPMFDHLALERFGIPRSRLPANSRVINKPDSLYSRHKSLIWGVLVVFLLLVTLVIGLLASILRRQRAEDRVNAMLRDKEHLFRELKESEEKYRLLFDTSDVLISVYDREGICQLMNWKTAGLFGGKPADFVGWSLAELHPEAAEEYRRRVRQTVDTGRTAEYEDEVTFPEGRRWLLSRVHPVPDAGGTFHAAQIISHDITERKRAEETIKAALAEKEVLLRELYHRTKNNMQVVSAMLAMQAQTIHRPDVQQSFKDMENRIQSMALVHHKLYQSKTLSSINLREYITELAGLLVTSYASADHISLNIEADDLYVLIDTAMPCGLVLNELISNALKHAFPGGRTGVIRISLRRSDPTHVELTVSDNGVGLPKGFDIRKTDTLGIQNVLALVERQLDGEIRFSNQNGLTCHIRLRNDLYTERV